MTLEAYAQQRVASLIDRLEAEVTRAATERDAEAIHDLRVSIRRFTQALRAFRSLLGKKAVKQVRSRLREVMDIAAEIRSRDIALGLFKSAELPLTAPVCTRLRKERQAHSRKLLTRVRGWHREQICAQWRELLRLKGAEA
ncbi:MAG: CHAD domain-containing protein [Bryobacterales bacterium]|nr:CHAD domain-containing protein [Bryobacterales bacterium]